MFSRLKRNESHRGVMCEVNAGVCNMFWLNDYVIYLFVWIVELIPHRATVNVDLLVMFFNGIKWLI